VTTAAPSTTTATAGQRHYGAWSWSVLAPGSVVVLHSATMRSARGGAVGSRFGSPHAVRKRLTNRPQSPALFGGESRRARSDYHRTTRHIAKRRQIPFSQVGRSHNPLVAGSSPARPTSEAIFGPYRVIVYSSSIRTVRTSSFTTCVWTAAGHVAVLSHGHLGVAEVIGADPCREALIVDQGGERYGGSENFVSEMARR
jgi:hypothetical protein